MKANSRLWIAGLAIEMQRFDPLGAAFEYLLYVGGQDASVWLTESSLLGDGGVVGGLLAEQNSRVYVEGAASASCSLLDCVCRDHAYDCRGRLRSCWIGRAGGSRPGRGHGRP